MISIEPKYDFITTMDKSGLLGGINLDFVYTLTQDVQRPPVIVMEMLNKDRTVLATETKLLRTKAGTYQDFIIGDKIRLPYNVATDREKVIKRLTDDYYYRITVK
ncbi:hypothetical protein [Brevibacillus fulvus]|uniref:Uncharacterized protein n=1 Tax=Brevibacillus fulvus TaxID=1125967 RepID=A0A938Y1S1_9BACL|nr:hypothetical protein [Brevibacillus fulvus]MBM7589585.1 hypothetical protein [Brevibacillus fulvus]